MLAFVSWAQEMVPDEWPEPASLVILSPLPDSTVSGSEPLEVSLLLAGVENLSIRLLIDGIDVTAATDITCDYLFYLSPHPPSKGTHSISVYGILNGDTLLSENWSFKATAAAPTDKAEKLPWEFSFGLGWRYAGCDQDTAGLGLSVPIGHQPSGQADLFGPLWGGQIQGDVSYDPKYDADPHGLVQLSWKDFEISLGEFYPDISWLAFANALPLGLLGKSRNGPINIDFTACRTASADTMISSFAQYLYGGKFGISLKESLSVALGYLQGYDQPSSLPDSVRFRTTTLVLADTIFGLTDTLVYIDSLHPASNRIGWLSAKKKFGPYWLEIEAAGTRTSADGGQRTSGRGYLARLARHSSDLDISLTYSSTDAGFRSFGSPYLETDKSELEGSLQAAWPRNFRTTLQGSVYQARADSAEGLGWSAGAGGYLSAGIFNSLWFKAEYSRRPYQTYLYQNRSLSAGLCLNLLDIRFQASYGYNSSSSPGTAQSHSISANASRRLYRRLAEASANVQYYQTQSLAVPSHHDKLTLTVSLSGVLAASFGYLLQAGRIMQNDRAEPTKSYRQQTAGAGINIRF